MHLPHTTPGGVGHRPISVQHSRHEPLHCHAIPTAHRKFLWPSRESCSIFHGFRVTMAHSLPQAGSQSTLKRGLHEPEVHVFVGPPPQQPVFVIAAGCSAAHRQPTRKAMLDKLGQASAAAEFTITSEQEQQLSALPPDVRSSLPIVSTSPCVLNAADPRVKSHQFVVCQGILPVGFSLQQSAFDLKFSRSLPLAHRHREPERGRHRRSAKESSLNISGSTSSRACRRRHRTF